jgi:hypothetical protein
MVVLKALITCTTRFYSGQGLPKSSQLFSIIRHTWCSAQLISSSGWRILLIQRWIPDRLRSVEVCPSNVTWYTTWLIPFLLCLLEGRAKLCQIQGVACIASVFSTCSAIRTLRASRSCCLCRAFAKRLCAFCWRFFLFICSITLLFWSFLAIPREAQSL